MAKPTGFMEFPRVDPAKQKVAQRLTHYREFEPLLPGDELTRQAARCMDCGIPACHLYGCPVVNLIPDWNDLLYRGHWRRALDLLHKTNNFPEVTGRVCPAPCEAACVLAINQPAVTIKQIELQIIERGFREGWVVPQRPAMKTGKSVAIVGAGPAGLAAAQQLARLGHTVVVFEKDDRIGGLLRYGIPDFKLEKWILDRRLEQMLAEGVVFEPSVNVGRDLTAAQLRARFDALLITAGAGVPRELPVPGRHLAGVHCAMEFLAQNNRRIAGETIPKPQSISAKGKQVVVIGGGDTGSDCIGTSLRQGATSVTQLELLPKPPDQRVERNPWPEWPGILRTSSSQEEGCERIWSVDTKECIGSNGAVEKLRCVRLEWSAADAAGRRACKEIPNSHFELPAQLALLAMGFVHVEHGPLVQDLQLPLDARGNILADENHMTAVPGVFVAGDAHVGASLVVRAINFGRRAAAGVDAWLLGT
ncbi:MAG: glutamate synthase subunit beta [bacterium]|nr:glutamate synthase subunit beta [bacterium]